MAEKMNVKLEPETIDGSTKGADQKNAGGTSYTDFDGNTQYFPEPFFKLQAPDQEGIAYYLISKDSDLLMKLYNTGGNELPASAELRFMKEDATGKKTKRISRTFNYGKWAQLDITKQRSSEQDVSLKDILLADQEIIREGQKLLVEVIDSNTIDVSNSSYQFAIYGKVAIKQGV